MLKELRRIREALEGAQPLGFGKKAQPTYVFVRHHSVGSETYLQWQEDDARLEPRREARGALRGGNDALGFKDPYAEPNGS